ncbi:MAG: hypothetical protein SGILL_005108 [Bacillariaceae sp.]
MLRVLCLHDAHSNSLELRQQLDALAEQLYLQHGIDLVFVNSPLLATTETTCVDDENDESATKKSPRGYQDPNLQPRVWWEEGVLEEEEAKTADIEAGEKSGEAAPSSNNHNNEHTAEDDNDGGKHQDTPDPSDTHDETKKRFVGLDASLLLLRQVWTSAPYWGILAVGQSASVASFLPLMEIDPRPSFAIFVEGFSLLEEEELLIDNFPCLHIVGKMPCKESERLVHQFGGEVSAGISPLGKVAINRIGKFLVAQKKELRLNPQDTTVLALQNQLFLAEQQAAHLVAQEIASNPPKALMAVISPKNVGGFSGGRRRAPDEEGGGAPCPSDFLLQREKRTTNPNGPTREHPSQKQPQQQGSQSNESQQQPMETQQESRAETSVHATSQENSAITVLLENPSKGNNLGPLLRCCSAFGITRIYVVGYDQCAVQGSHGASKHVELVPFQTHEAAVKHLVNEEGFKLVGLLKGVPQSNDEDMDQDSSPVCKEEIEAWSGRTNVTKLEEIVNVAASSTKRNTLLPDRNSSPVHLRKFSARTCLVVDKKSRGLSWSLAQHCHSFMHLPHYPSINKKQAVTNEACLSIALYEFTMWAGFNDQSYKGQKYHVKQVQKGAKDDAAMLERRHKEREQKIEEQQAEADELGAMSSSIFTEDQSNEGDY